MPRRAGAGRPIGTTNSESVRQHIKVAMIVKKVQRFLDADTIVEDKGQTRYFLGDKDVTMTKDQLAAATLLLSKSMPSLASTDVNAKVETTNYVPVSDRLPDPRTIPVKKELTDKILH